MSARVDVTAYGAKGDGHTNDMPSIRAAIAACHPGDELVFPRPSVGYFVGTDTVFDIPEGVRLTGVARLPAGFERHVLHTAAPQPVGLALAPDAQGVIDASRGHVFDGGGIVIGTYNPIAFPGRPISFKDGSVLLATQVHSGEYWSIRASTSHDALASLTFAEWILRDQIGPLVVSESHAMPGGTMSLTFDGSPWSNRHALTPTGLDVLVTDGAGKGQGAQVVTYTDRSVVARSGKAWATMPDATTRITIGTNLLDCDLAQLADGTIVGACEQIGASGSAIRFVRSTDGGRNWTATARVDAVDRALPKPAPGGPQLGAVKLLRLQHPVPGLKGRDHVAALFCITIVRPGGGFVSDYVIALSGDGFETVASMRLLGASHLDGVDNEINDGNQGALYEREDRPGLMAMVPLWTASQPDTNRIYQIECDETGVPVRGQAPRLVTVVPISTAHGGSFPEVIKLTTGEYGLYFSGTDFTHQPWDHGAMYFMSSKDGSLGSFTGVRRLWIKTGFPHGYGFPHAVRLANGELVIMISAVTSANQSEIRVFRHYAA